MPLLWLWLWSCADAGRNPTSTVWTCREYLAALGVCPAVVTASQPWRNSQPAFALLDSSFAICCPSVPIIRKLVQISKLVPSFFWLACCLYMCCAISANFCSCLLRGSQLPLIPNLDAADYPPPGSGSGTQRRRLSKAWLFCPRTPRLCNVIQGYPISLTLGYSCDGCTASSRSSSNQPT